MAIRCFGRARLAESCARALVLRSLALMVFRAVDLAAVLLAVLRAGDFFCAAVRAAARDVGFCLAIRCLPDLRRVRLSGAPLQGGEPLAGKAATNIAACPSLRWP